MGYELKKLMNMYGVSTPTMAPAPQMLGKPPTAPTAPVLAEGATRDQRKKYEEDLAAFNASKEKYATDKTAFDESVRKYGLDKSQYDQYARDYQNRLANTNMYNQAQFSTTGANVPAFTTYSDEQVAAPPTGTQYGVPQWSDAIRAPSYGMMPITFGQMSEQDRANWYNTQRGLGYTDADLRANAESTFGQMSDPDFSQMTGGAYTPPKSGGINIGNIGSVLGNLATSGNLGGLFGSGSTALGTVNMGTTGTTTQGGGGRDRDDMREISRPGNGTGTGSFGLPDPFGRGSRNTSGGYKGFGDRFDGGGPGVKGGPFQGGGILSNIANAVTGRGAKSSKKYAEGGYIQNYAEGGDVANSPAKMSGLGAKPNMKEFMDATGVDSKTAAQILYGSIGSNRDIRDWNAIMAATKPVQAAQAATGQMYSTGAPIATDQRFYKDGAYNPGAMSTQYAVTDVAGSGGPRLQTINGTLMIVDKSGLPLTQLTPENAASFGVAQDTINTAISSGAIQGGDERVNAFKVAGFQPYEAGNFLRADYGSLLGAPLEQGNNLAQAERTWGMAPLSSPQIQNVNPPQNYAEGGTVQGYAPGGTIYGGAGDDMLMGRPADDMLAPAPAPVAEDPQDPLMAMLARYATPVDRSAEIAAATERRAAEQKTLEELLMKQLDVQDNAPQSKAEMYLRLAAAFGAPTKTGHFSENLALVGQTMADELAARSQREREDRANRLGIQTELQKMRLDAAGEALAVEQGLQKSETEYGRDLYKESLKGSEGKFRRATKAEAAAYGAEGGQFGPDGRFYAVDVPQGMTIESDGQGGFRMVQGPGGGKSDKPPTEGQLGSAAYLQRMTKAEAILRDLERTEEVVTIPLEKTLLMGTGAEGYILNSTEQRVAQAQRDWVRAKLRKESGAVIGAEEMAEEIKTYFPQPGESPETIAQKAASRRSAEEQMRITSGTAAEEAGEISPEYAPPIRADELARAGIGGGPAPQPVVIDGVAPPEVGTIDNGYRFKGGNPADPNNWEKV